MPINARNLSPETKVSDLDFAPKLEEAFLWHEYAFLFRVSNVQGSPGALAECRVNANVPPSSDTDRHLSEATAGQLVMSRLMLETVTIVVADSRPHRHMGAKLPESRENKEVDEGRSHHTREQVLWAPKLTPSPKR